MTALKHVSWLTDGQREILARHQCGTLEQLASLELRDSLADAIAVDNLRGLAKRARQSLGLPDPMEQLGQAAGHHGPVRYAGGKEANG